MDPRTHDVTCPCCDAVISVDAESGAVLSFKPPPKKRVSFEEAASAVRGEKGRVESKFARALQERSRHGEILEKKFRKAAEKAAEDPGKPPNPLDLD